MNIKMKVVTMEFLNKQNQQQSQPDNEDKECKIKHTARKWLQIIKQDTIYRVDNFRQLITEDTIPMFIKIIDQFTKNFKMEREERKARNSNENEKDLKGNVEKLSRKLNQALYLIQHLKEKLEKKQWQIMKRDEIIVNLKRQCQQWKQKCRKDLIVKQLSESSSLLLNNLHLSFQSYQRPLEVSKNLELAVKKDNFLYRTSSFELNQNKSTIEEAGHKRNLGKTSQFNIECKLPLRISKRDNQKTSQKLRTKQQSNKENERMENGLRVTQKQLSPHKARQLKQN